jgi:hypothetical protein
LCKLLDSYGVQPFHDFENTIFMPYMATSFAKEILSYSIARMRRLNAIRRRNFLMDTLYSICDYAYAISDNAALLEIDFILSSPRFRHLDYKQRGIWGQYLRKVFPMTDFMEVENDPILHNQQADKSYHDWNPAWNGNSLMSDTNKLLYPCDNFVSQSTLNGSHGEYTGTDDLKDPCRKLIMKPTHFNYFVAVTGFRYMDGPIHASPISQATDCVAISLFDPNMEILRRPEIHITKSQLNGAHGEYTGTDDLQYPGQLLVPYSLAHMASTDLGNATIDTSNISAPISKPKGKSAIATTTKGTTKAVPIPKQTQFKSTANVVGFHLKDDIPVLGHIADFVLNGLSGLAGVVGGILPQAGNVATLAGLFLDKPNSVASVIPNVNTELSDICHGEGLTNAHPASLALNPYVDITNFTQPDVIKMCQIPGYMGTFTISAATAAKATIFSNNLSPRDLAFTSRTGAGPFTYLFKANWFWHYARAYRYWRGSIKMLINFETSGFTSCRIRMLVLPAGAAVLSDPEVLGNDVYSVVMDVRGSCTFQYVLPFQNPYLVATVPPFYGVAGVDQSPDTQSGGVVYMYVQQPPTIPDASGNSTVYINVWTAPCDDLQLIGFQGVNYITANEPHSKAKYPGQLLVPNSASHMKLFEKFSSGSGWLPLGDAQRSSVVVSHAHPADPTNLSALLRRARELDVMPTVADTIFQILPHPNKSAQFYYWTKGFMGWSGSIVYTYYATDGTYIKFLRRGNIITDSLEGELGIIMTFNKALSFIFPYEYFGLWRPMWDVTGTFDFGTATASGMLTPGGITRGKLLMAAGEDFTLIQPLTPGEQSLVNAV